MESPDNAFGHLLTWREGKSLHAKKGRRQTAVDYSHGWIGLLPEHDRALQSRQAVGRCSGGPEYLPATLQMLLCFYHWWHGAKVAQYLPPVLLVKASCSIYFTPFLVPFPSQHHHLHWAIWFGWNATLLFLRGRRNTVLPVALMPCLFLFQDAEIDYLCAHHGHEKVSARHAGSWWKSTVPPPVTSATVP